MHFRKAKIVVALCQATARNSPPDCCIYIFESPSVNAIPIKKPPHRDGFLIGGPEEIRTPDPYNANVMRSQLRYGPRFTEKLYILAKILSSTVSIFLLSFYKKIP